MNISRDTFATIATAVDLGWFCFTFDRTSTAKICFILHVTIVRSKRVSSETAVLRSRFQGCRPGIPSNDRGNCMSFGTNGRITELLRSASCRYVAVSGMNMPFAPLSAKLVCWNNQITIENEVLNFLKCSWSPVNLWILYFHWLPILPRSLETCVFFAGQSLFQELVITGWNVADGYLPPTKSFSLLWSDYWPSLDIHRVMSQRRHRNCITAMRSTSFKRNDDGFTNTYRTGNWAQTFGTWQLLILWESVMFTP